MITGSEDPDSGEFNVGETVKLGYVNQDRDLDPDKTVWETISGGSDFIQLGTKEVNSRAYVGRFNFGGQDQQKKVGTLSGGERGRLQLAVTLKEGANVLLAGRADERPRRQHAAGAGGGAPVVRRLRRGDQRTTAGS